MSCVALSHFVIREVGDGKSLVAQHLPDYHLVLLYLLPSQRLERHNDVGRASAVVSVAKLSDIPGMQQRMKFSEGPLDTISISIYEWNQ